MKITVKHKHFGIFVGSHGIKIFDKKNGLGRIDLSEILNVIQNGDSYYWSILFLDVVGNVGENKTPQFQDRIFDLECGLFLTWDELNSLSKNIEQLISISLLGCKDVELIKRYEDDQESYETCDIVIELVDSAFWIVFSNDEELINRLAAKFKIIEFLEPDYLDKYLESLNQK